MNGSLDQSWPSTGTVTTRVRPRPSSPSDFTSVGCTSSPTTTVTGGRLNITGSAATPLATSGVAVSAGAILNFFNGVGQTLTLASTAGSLNLGAGASGGAALGLELGSTTNYDRLATAGAATVANKVLLNLTGLSGLQAGQYDLITAQSGLSGGAFSIGTLSNFGGYSFALNTSDTAVSLVTTALVPNLYWRVGSDVSWSSLNYANYDTNFFTDAAGTTNAKGFPGVANKVIFSTTNSSATSYVTTLDGNFTVGSLQFTSTPTGVTSVVIAPGGPEAAALTLAPASSADGITVDANAGAISVTAPLVLGSSQTWNVAGTGANGSSLTLTGGITGLAGNNLTLTGGAGTVFNVSGTSTYAGSTTLDGVTLQAAAANAFSSISSFGMTANGGVLALNSYSNVIGSLSGAYGFVENSGSGAFLNAVPAAATLTLGGDNANVNFGGVIRDGSAFALSLTKNGTGAQTLSGNNLYTGNTTVNAGSLNITGSYVGSATTTLLIYGNSSGKAVVNVAGDMSLFATQGANAFGAVSVYNQTAGNVILGHNTSGSSQFIANADGYGYFNLTGGVVALHRGYKL